MLRLNNIVQCIEVTQSRGVSIIEVVALMSNEYFIS
jgi:hypothetical protein